MNHPRANPTQTDAASVWQPADLWSPAQQLQVLWPWLTHAGSLTEKLRATVGSRFHVRVRHEGVARLSAEDAVLLHTLPGTAVRVREVQLCGEVPMVYARTLALADAAEWLNDLNSRPLGERVFAENDTQRGVIAMAQLDASRPLYRAAVAGCVRPPAMLWARRSVLTVRASRLLIYECFLGVPEG